MDSIPENTKLNNVAIEIAYNEGFRAGKLAEENEMTAESLSTINNTLEHTGLPHIRSMVTEEGSTDSDDEYADSSESDPQPKKRKHRTSEHSAVRFLIETITQQVKDFHAHSNVTTEQKQEIYQNAFKLILQDQKTLDALPDKLGSFMSHIVSDMKGRKNEKMVFLNKVSSLFTNEIGRLEGERKKDKGE